MSFVKIFEQIYDSSIAEDWKVRLVFQDMLILADKNGVVDRTVEAIARRTNVPVEIVREAIPVLEAPDPMSRTPVNDGRRIVRLDLHREWGWQIVNFQKFRESATKDMLRLAEAERKRQYRQRYSPPHTPPKDRVKEEEAEAEADMSQLRPDMSRTNSANCSGSSHPTLDQVKVNGHRIGMTEQESERFWNHFESSGWVDKHGNMIRNWSAKQSSWLASNRARPGEQLHHGNTGVSASLQATVDSKELERVSERIRRIASGAAADAMGTKYYSEAEKKELRELISRRDVLKTKLGIKF